VIPVNRKELSVILAFVIMAIIKLKVWPHAKVNYFFN